MYPKCSGGEEVKRRDLRRNIVYLSGVSLLLSSQVDYLLLEKLLLIHSVLFTWQNEKLPAEEEVEVNLKRKRDEMAMKNFLEM